MLMWLRSFCIRQRCEYGGLLKFLKINSRAYCQQTTQTYTFLQKKLKSESVLANESNQLKFSSYTYYWLQWLAANGREPSSFVQWIYCPLWRRHLVSLSLRLFLFVVSSAASGTALCSSECLSHSAAFTVFQFCVKLTVLNIELFTNAILNSDNPKCQ